MNGIERGWCQLTRAHATAARRVPDRTPPAPRRRRRHPATRRSPPIVETTGYAPNRGRHQRGTQHSIVDDHFESIVLLRAMITASALTPRFISLTTG